LIKAINTNNTARRTSGREINEYFSSACVSSGEFREFIETLKLEIPETVVFGGMLRDFYFDLPSNFQSDIDFVCSDPSAKIERVLHRYNPVKNKFGGFRMVVGKYPVDIWALDQTWAFKQGLVEGNDFEDLCSTTFFNVDAVYFPIKGSRVEQSKSFKAATQTRVLDINLEENPSPDKAAKRAISLSLKLNLMLSVKLQHYVLEHVDSALTSVPIYSTFIGLLKEHVELKEKGAKPFEFCPQGSLIS